MEVNCSQEWHMSTTPALRKLRQEDRKFTASLDHIARPRLRLKSKRRTLSSRSVASVVSCSGLVLSLCFVVTVSRRFYKGPDQAV